ncbi:MAG: sulfatase-like hydrolase/transferase, partial [Syntrophales bacterium LBB04]|nr:sulfatase-like hydrolase/transferase [Syntrophales bacterium LBB04]
KKGGPGGKKRFFLISMVAIFIIAFALYFLIQGRFLPRGQKSLAEAKKLLGNLDTRDFNVLLFTLDTTRADHIGCYGYSRIETPNIDSLAGEGFLFKNATSQAPLTLPSHSSIFTGTYPLYHSVRDNGGFYLGADKTTLAKVLQKSGWATSAFVAAFVLDSRWGLNQGFDYYYDNFDFAKYKTISLDSVQREGGEVVKAFFDWFATNSQKKFFSWLHFYDPHTPYEPPEPFKTKYGVRPWGLYDGEIAYVDTLVGKVVAELKKKDLLKKTIIIIVGDHGESLGEHHESSHGFFVYDATQSVPLIVRVPSSAIKGRVVESQVENVDIMPSVLELLGLPIPKEVQGKSFLPLMAGRSASADRMAYSETYYPRYHYGWSELKSLRSTRYKFIQAPRPELYDLSIDPTEQINIFNENTSLGRRFERDLKDLQEKMSIKGVETKGPQKLDDDAREKLMALGYVGGFTSSSKMAKSGMLGDPKDKIILYNKIKQAEGFSANKEFDDSLKLLNEVIAQDPNIMEARQVRANIYLELDRPEDSIIECKEALKTDEEYEAAIFTMAQAYKKLKRYDNAIAGFNRIMQLDPRDPKSYINLGEIYCETKEFDKAIANLQKAISIDSEHSAVAHNLLGSAYLEKKTLDLAEKEISISIQMRPRIPDAHYNLGLLYEEKGDFPRAVEEYKKEIEIHPAAYPAHFNLGLLYAKLGRLREALAEYKEAIKFNKKFARSYLFLAKANMDLNENFEEAISLAKKGLELEPEAESAPLGHYVLADIYNRLGRMAEYAAEVEKGKALEQKLKKTKT